LRTTALYWRVNAKNASGQVVYGSLQIYHRGSKSVGPISQHPSSTVINTGGSATFLSRVYAQKITEATGQGAGIKAG
jgi:hypothetical protein